MPGWNSASDWLNHAGEWEGHRLDMDQSRGPPVRSPHLSSSLFFSRPLFASPERRGRPAHIMTCRRRCSARWSDREKLRSQSMQRNGLIPVCLRKCLVSSSERANFQVQPSQVHL